MTSCLELKNNTEKTIQSRQEMPACNGTYKKLAVQWLTESLCFDSSSVQVDSFVLRNSPERIARNHCRQTF
ncbi:MAG: hypothetical protein U0V04_09795 [Spirosomataceae bacterium]|jgi:hypothetical protein